MWDLKENIYVLLRENNFVQTICVIAEVHYFWEDRAQMVRMQAKLVFIVMQEIF